MGGVTGAIQLLDYRDGSLVREFNVHGSRVLGLAFSPTGETLFSAGDQPGGIERAFALRATATRTGQSTELLPLEARPVRMSRHGDRLALAAGDALLVYNTEARKLEQQWRLEEAGPAQDFVYWPQQNLFVSASPSGRVALWRPGVPRSIGSFHANERALRANAVAELAANKLVDRRKLVEAALQLATAASQDGDLSRAAEMVRVATTVATQLKEPKLRTEVDLRRKEIDELTKVAELGEAAARRLQTDPDNPKAHLALGRFLILLQADWTNGLPHLARSDDAKIKACATADLEAPETTEAKLAMGDRWWDAAQAGNPADKNLCLARAHLWYHQVAAAATGLDKLRAEKRVNEIRAAVPADLIRPKVK